MPRIRHRDVDVTCRTHTGAEVSEYLPGVHEVLEDVVAEDGVEVLLERADDVLGRAYVHDLVVLARELGDLRDELDADDTRRSREPQGPVHRAGGAADVEDCSYRLGQELPDEMTPLV